MKKLKLGLLSLCSLALVACGNSEVDQTTTTTNDTESSDKQQLVVSTFALSEDVVNDTVFKPFEEEHNVEIVVETGNAGERFNKFKANANNNIDIIELNQVVAQEGEAADFFEALSADDVANIADLIDVAKELQEEGGHGPAYTLNSLGIIVSPEFEGEITEWSDLWSPELEGKVAIPDITTTYGPHFLYVASDHAGVDITSDNGEAAFEALEDLKGNVKQTYSRSSDLANLFSTGEIQVAVVADFAVPIIQKAMEEAVYFVPESGTYANFNTININKTTDNMDLAKAFVDWRISNELQTKTAEELNEAPTNKTVELTQEQAGDKTYGDVAERAKAIDAKFVNEHLAQWTDQFNRTMN